MGTVFPTGPLRVASDGKRGLNRQRPRQLGPSLPGTGPRGECRPIEEPDWTGTERLIRQCDGDDRAVRCDIHLVRVGTRRLRNRCPDRPLEFRIPCDSHVRAGCSVHGVLHCLLDGNGPAEFDESTGENDENGQQQRDVDDKLADAADGRPVGRGGIVGSSQTEGKEAGVMPGRGEESGAPPRIRTLLRVFAPRGRDPEMPCRNLAVPLRLRRLRPQGTVVPGFPNGTGGCPGTGEWIRRRGGCWKSSGKQNLNGFTVCHSLTNPDKIGATSCGGSLLCQVLTPSWQPVRPCTSQHQERFAFRTHACLDTHVRQYSGTQ